MVANAFTRLMDAHFTSTGSLAVAHQDLATRADNSHQRPKNLQLPLSAQGKVKIWLWKSTRTHKHARSRIAYARSVADATSTIREMSFPLDHAITARRWTTMIAGLDVLSRGTRMAGTASAEDTGTAEEVGTGGMTEDTVEVGRAGGRSVGKVREEIIANAKRMAGR